MAAQNTATAKPFHARQLNDDDDDDDNNNNNNNNSAFVLMGQKNNINNTFVKRALLTGSNVESKSFSVSSHRNSKAISHQVLHFFQNNENDINQ